jgi:hypothetical protein
MLFMDPNTVNSGVIQVFSFFTGIAPPEFLFRPVACSLHQKINLFVDL